MPPKTCKRNATFLVQGAGAIPRNEPGWIHDLLRHILASVRLLRARLVELRRQSVTTNVHHALLLLGLVWGVRTLIQRLTTHRSLSKYLI